MTGIASLHAGMRHENTLSLVVGSGSFNRFGYANNSAVSPYGSVSSASVNFRGIRVSGINYAAPTPNQEFSISIEQAGLPQAFFSKVIAQDGAGVLRTYNIGTVTLFDNTSFATTTQWWWADASVVWGAGNIGQTFTLRVIA